MKGGVDTIPVSPRSKFRSDVNCPWEKGSGDIRGLPSSNSHVNCVSLARPAGTSEIELYLISRCSSCVSCNITLGNDESRFESNFSCLSLESLPSDPEISETLFLASFNCL